MKAEILNVRTLHKGWTTFSIAKVRLHDGTEVDREIEDHGNSVGVLPYDPDRRVAAFVRELRVCEIACNVVPLRGDYRVQS